MGRGGRLWRRKSSRTRTEQGVWHQWQCHADAVRGKVAAGEDALLLLLLLVVVVVVVVVHGWVDGVGAAGAAGTAAAAMGVGTATSTASEAGAGEP